MASSFSSVIAGGSQTAEQLAPAETSAATGKQYYHQSRFHGTFFTRQSPAVSALISPA